MLKPKIIEKLKDSKSDYFRVQTTFPGAYINDPKRDGNKNFGDYSASAFIHKDTIAKIVQLRCCRVGDQSMVIWTHKEMFLDTKWVDPYSHTKDKFITSTMDFTNFEDAARVARFIAEECELMTGYCHGMPWQEDYRGPIRTRVVFISTRQTMHVVA